MTERAGAPKIDDAVVDKKGMQTSITLRFFEKLDRFLNGREPYPFPVFSDLAAIQSKYKKPNSGMTVFVQGQGLAVYDSGTWVRSSDGTTAIT